MSSCLTLAALAQVAIRERVLTINGAHFRKIEASMQNNQLQNPYSKLTLTQVKILWFSPLCRQGGQLVYVDKQTREDLGTEEWLRDQRVWDICDYGQFRIGLVWVGGWIGQKVLVVKMPPEFLYPEADYWQTVAAGRAEEFDNFVGYLEAAVKEKMCQEKGGDHPTRTIS